MGFSAGIMQYSATLFFKPVAETLAVSRTVLSIAVALGRIGGAIEAPIVGYFIDRLGPKWPMRFGLALAGLGLILFGLFANSLILFFLTWTGMVTLGFGSIGGFAPAWAAINNWFVRKKGRAMGIGMSSHGIGGALLAPAIASLILLFGWRVAAMFAGLAVIFLVLPVTSLIRTRPEDMGLSPDGDIPTYTSHIQNVVGDSNASTQAIPSNLRNTVVDFTVRQAVRTPTLWILILAMGIRQFGQAGMLLHLGPLLQDRGFSIIQTGGAIGFMALMAVPGALACGWVSDHFQRRYVMTAIVIAEAAALAVLFLANTTGQIYIFILIYGFGQGAHVLNRAILGEYFGQRSYGKIWGVIAMSTTLLSWGQVYAGWIYDTTHSYNIAIMTFIVLYIAAAILYLNCRRPDYVVPL
jgi:sugar phosphate permease